LVIVDNAACSARSAVPSPPIANHMVRRREVALPVTVNELMYGLLRGRFGGAHKVNSFHQQRTRVYAERRGEPFCERDLDTIAADRHERAEMEDILNSKLSLVGPNDQAAVIRDLCVASATWRAPK
jgi:hypothetical protein